MAALLSNKISLIVGVSAFVASLYAFAPAPAEAAQLQRCAGENETCRLPYPTEVIYGANGRGTSQFIDGPNVRCSNQVLVIQHLAHEKLLFVVRDRYENRRDDRRNDWRDNRRDDWRDDRRNDWRDDRGRGDWQQCAKEKGFCDFYGRKVVRYGAKGRYVERVFRDGVRCDNRSFGDPARGQKKPVTFRTKIEEQIIRRRSD
ncbi:hypothetical protein HED51_11455 [Ochrobactrum grignonense]|nr:hypothetical protein [Brucella grignonensis]